MVAHPLIAFRGPVAGENVKSDFKPIFETLRDLERFVQRVFIGTDAVYRRLRSLKCEVRMELHHGASWWHHFAAIHLHFIVALRQESATAAGQHQQRSENGQTHTSDVFRLQ